MTSVLAKEHDASRAARVAAEKRHEILGLHAAYDSILVRWRMLGWALLGSIATIPRGYGFAQELPSIALAKQGWFSPQSPIGS